MPTSSLSRKTKTGRPILPHERLRNMYIGLFLVLGALLCIAEVSRQVAIANQAQCIETVDEIRLQCDRIHAIRDGLFVLLTSDDPIARTVAGSALPGRIDHLRSTHAELSICVETERDLSPSVIELTARASELTDRLSASASSLATQGGLLTAMHAANEYDRVMYQAAMSMMENSQEGMSSLASLSMMMFLIIAGVLAFEALFLILPATHSLRRQWEQMKRSSQETQRLSDKFSQLIESTARIKGLADDGEGTKIVIRPGDSSPEAVFDFAQLRAVQASLRLFEVAIANSRDGIVIVEHAEKPKVIYTNDTMLEMSGLESSDLLGDSPFAIHRGGTDSEQFRKLARALEGATAIRIETEQPRRDGSRYRTEIDAVPVFDAGDALTHWVLVYRDVTARAEYQAALEESSERFELIGRVAVDGIYDLDLIKGVCWRNEPLLRDFGRPEEGEDFFEWLRTRIHPDEADSMIEAFLAFTASDRSSWEREYRQMKTDGTWARVLDRATLIRDPRGRPVRLVGSLNDMTLQHEQQWQIQQSESRLRDILNDQTELVCRYKAGGVLTFVNHAYARYFDTTPERLIGTSFIDLIAEEDRSAALEFIASLRPDSPIADSLHRVRSGSGEIRWQRWTDRVITDSEGEIIEYQAVGRDVTEEILAKQELEQAESRYGAFIRNSSEAIFRIELDPPIETDLPPAEQAELIIERGVIAEANDSFSEQYGHRSAAESIGLTLREMLGSDPDLRAENLRTIEDLVRASYLVDDLISHERKADGSPVVFSNNTVGIVEDGRLHRVWGTQRDITEQRRAEQELRWTNTVLGLFIEHAPAAVAMFDSEMRYMAASQRWISDYGLEGDAVIGESHYDVFSHITEEWREIHRRCLKGETVAREEDCMIANDGRTKWIRWEVLPWTTPEGVVGGIMMFTEDITERKRIADRLREVNAQQSRMLTELDHRVKNALGGLLTLIEMGTVEQSDVRAYAQSIARRVRSMAAVHAMLSESSWRPLQLVEIIKNITPGDTPGRLYYAGPDLLVPAHQATSLAMVLQELVSNSMKYGALSTAGAQVRVSWTTTAVSDHETAMTLTWSESGGPPVTPDPEPGLGTQLVNGFARFELRGSIDLDFSSPEGVRHTLTCRLIADGDKIPGGG
ncbi:MAG: PAS domain S-box protein [Phycisphaerales bacterium]